MNKILVTGGAGYIGSHTCLQLLKEGYEVIILDNLEKGHQETLDALGKIGSYEFINVDLRNLDELRKALEPYSFDAVIHFAAYLEVGFSTRNPELFFQNNVVGSQNLLQVLIEKNILNFIFSSSAAVYGTQESVPISETASMQPDSPYGETKLIIEQILRNYAEYRDMNAIALRYFNPAGAVAELPGERHIPETHVIPLLFHSFIDDDFTFSVYGDDYETTDGSAIRDFIHIADLADAHVKSVKYLQNMSGFEAFNVATGKGTSVLELVKTAEEVVGEKLNYNLGPRRAGDPKELVADPSKIMREMDWDAKYNLKDMLSSAWEWERQRDLADYTK